MTTNGVGLAVREERSLGLSGSVQITGLRDVFALAERLANARGFVPRHLLGDANGIAAAILTGIELGMGPMESMRSIFMVDGKPTMSSELMLARALRAGVRVKWLTKSSDKSRQAAHFSRGGETHEHEFTIEEARDAGLAGKDNWKKYTAAMLRARCVSGAMRAFCPDVLGSGVYTPDELDVREAPDGSPMPEVAPVAAEVAQAPVRQRRVVETEHGEIIEVPSTFAEVTDAETFRLFAKEKREALSALVNGQREKAIAKCDETAARLGMDAQVARVVCGLADEEPA